MQRLVLDAGHREDKNMSTIKITAARAIADPAEGQLLACAEIEVDPERVFRVLTSEEPTEAAVHDAKRIR